MLPFADQSQMIQHMRDELTNSGFTELRTPAEVDAALASQPGSLLLLINSVCGCAAGAARPGVIASLRGAKRPEALVTVFAGQDREATERAREYLAGHPPSSPCAVVFREGQVVHMMPRHEIEGRSAEQVGRLLATAYEQAL